VGRDHVLFVHVTLVPYVGSAGELKTKPTQHSVRELREIGIQPDILLCRCDRDLPREIKSKIALYCNLKPEDVISARDVPSVYEVPLNLHEDELDRKIVEKLNIWTRPANLQDWIELRDSFNHPSDEVRIAIVGKYVSLVESYKSLHEALIHAGIATRARVIIDYVDSELLESDDALMKTLRQAEGILIPGGFGERGIEGKMAAIHYARTEQVPFLGICLGMHAAVIEFARHELGLPGANSREFDPRCPDPVIDIMDHQRSVSDKGGTMRLGAYLCDITPRSLAHEIYGRLQVSERHRHRYEVNNKYRRRLQQKGLQVSGVYKEGNLVEFMEHKTHPWFFGCQAHPEFKSRPLEPHPIFVSFVRAALDKRHGRLKPRKGARRSTKPAAAKSEET